MQNLIEKAAKGLARVLDGLTQEQRDAAIRWASDKLSGNAAKPKRRKRRAVKPAADAPEPEPEPEPETPPAARKTVRRKRKIAGRPRVSRATNDESDDSDE